MGPMPCIYAANATVLRAKHHCIRPDGETYGLTDAAELSARFSARFTA
jgi:hypothetical protein